MSGRLLTSRLAPFARQWSPWISRHVTRSIASNAGGLLQNAAARTGRVRPWPLGSNSLHNVPAVRTISFARIVPKLFMKFARIPAMFGGATIAGLAYVQYQATREVSYL
jgi:hypothetical protein